MEVKKFNLSKDVAKELFQKSIDEKWFFFFVTLLQYRDESFDLDEFLPSDNYENDLGLDSMDKAQIMMDLERIFDIRIADDEAERLYTIADTLLYLAKKVAVEKIPNEFSLD